MKPTDSKTKIQFNRGRPQLLKSKDEEGYDKSQTNENVRVNDQRKKSKGQDSKSKK